MDCFHQTIFISASAKKLTRKKKRKEDEQNLEELNSAHRRSQAKCHLAQTTLNELNCYCFCHVINILLTELSRSVWENLDLSRVYRPHCVRSVLTTSVKILQYRPPARLIRAKYCIVLYCIVCNARESKSPAVSKNKKTRNSCVIGFVWEMKAARDGLLEVTFC